MKHYLNAMKMCDCLGCKSAQEDELQEEKKKTPEQKEKEKKVDDIAKAQEEKLKKLLEDKEAMMHMTDEELDKLMADLLDEMKQIRKEMGLPNDDEKKQSKQASIEFLGVDSQISKIKQTKYSVLNYEPYHDNKTSGDQLLIRMGSTDDNTVGNSKGDAFLKSLGSVD